MSRKNEFIAVVIWSVLIMEFGTTIGRIHEGKYGNHPEPNKINRHDGQTRHRNHYHLHKKQRKCDFDPSYYKPRAFVKKTSRYPTLDKIVDRLDNRIDRRSDRSKIAASTDPFDDWNFTAPIATTFADKRDKYTYVTVGWDGGSTTAETVRERTGGNHPSENFRDRNNNDNNNNVGNRDAAFVQDFTTAGSPWENEQRDVNAQGTEAVPKETSRSSTPVSALPVPSTPVSEVRGKVFDSDKSVSRSPGETAPPTTEGEDRQKKKTSSVTPAVALNEQLEQMLRMGDCHLPKEKVIRVHEVHPDPSKKYFPSCTVLHRCGEDTGCCQELQVCKPKNTTRVERYFFTWFLGRNKTIEKLDFVNHTECECQKRTDEFMPRDSEFRKPHPKKSFVGRTNEEKRKRNDFSCPVKYSTRYLPNGTRTCDCFDKQDDCLVLKKGKEHFSHADKKCIQQGICLLPSCEFGSYIRRLGRCPKRSEKHRRGWNRALPYGDVIT